MGQVVGRKRLLHTQNCMNSQTLCTDTLLRCFPASLPGIQSTKAFWPLLSKESSWLCSLWKSKLHPQLGHPGACCIFPVRASQPYRDRGGKMNLSLAAKL